MKAQTVNEAVLELEVRRLKRKIAHLEGSGGMLPTFSMAEPPVVDHSLNVDAWPITLHRRRQALLTSKIR